MSWKPPAPVPDGLYVERRARVGRAVEIDLPAGLAVDQHFGAAAAGLLEKGDLEPVVGKAAARPQAERGAGVARHRVEAGEVEATILVRLLQRFVGPAVGGVAVEQRRAHAQVRLAGHDIGRPARAEHLLQALAHAAGEIIGRGMAVAELQDRQATGGEELGRQFAVGGKRGPRASHGGQGRLQRGERAQSTRVRPVGVGSIVGAASMATRSSLSAGLGGASAATAASLGAAPSARRARPPGARRRGRAKRLEIRRQRQPARRLQGSLGGGFARRAARPTFAVRLAPAAPISRTEAHASSAPEFRNPSPRSHLLALARRRRGRAASDSP